MKQSTLLVTLSLFGLTLIGCGEEEAPAELPPPPAAAVAPVQASEPSAAPAEPELKPIAPMVPASISEPLFVSALSSTGSYVIQVGIQPSKKGANRLASKLSESGIQSYLAQVENPGELEGTYYRVRIGYFATVTDAKNYAKATLEPLGFAWWIDSRRNDEVGNPAGSEDAIGSGYSSQPAVPSSSDWNTPPPPPPAAAAPVPAPAPAPAAPPPAVQKAPVATIDDDDWGTPAPPPPPSAPAPVIEDDGWN